jgi:hypothetical protein
MSLGCVLMDHKYLAISRKLFLSQAIGGGFNSLEQLSLEQLSLDQLKI